MADYAEELTNFITESLDNTFDDAVPAFYSAHRAPDGVEVEVYSADGTHKLLATLKVAVTDA